MIVYLKSMTMALGDTAAARPVLGQLAMMGYRSPGLEAVLKRLGAGATGGA